MNFLYYDVTWTWISVEMIFLENTNKMRADFHFSNRMNSVVFSASRAEVILIS